MGKIIRPYQAEAAMMTYEKKRLLIADDMGLGKTAEAILGKNLVDRRQGYHGKAIVICPTAVMQHWDREIAEWYTGNPKTTHIYTTSYDEDVKGIDETDFTIIGYPTMSKLGSENGKLGYLLRGGFQYGIIDEAHNAKNPSSLRSSSSRELLHSIDYLNILTGTPLPNTVMDIYALMNLLDPSFSIDSENPKEVLSQFYQVFKKNPDYVRSLLNSKMLRRTPKDVGLEDNFPTLKVKNLEVMLEDEHRDAYLQIYENGAANPGAKLPYLVGTSIDPNLAPARLLDEKLASQIGSMNSSVYSELDKLIERVADENGKVLIFSGLKNGVTSPLVERYSSYGALLIDASVPVANRGGHDEREEIRKKFQTDKDHKVLVLTTVMNEGVDLTAATDIVHLTLPYTPAEFDQRNRRTQRIGEIDKDEVNAHVIMPKLDLIPVVTEGIQQLINEKRTVASYILEKPNLVTKDGLSLLRQNGFQNTPQIGMLLDPKSMYKHFGSLKGFEKTLEYYERNPSIAENVARLYAANWEGYMSGNTGELYSQVIGILGQQENLESKLDIASGPFSLSRALQEPVMNIDINPQMIAVGKILAKQGKIPKGNKAKVSPLHTLPLKNEQYDIAVCSLALHMTKIETGTKGNKLHEREQAFREMNRVLRPEGYGIITLPSSRITESDLPRFYDGLGDLGFEVLPFSGFYKGGKEKQYKVYMLGLQKVGIPQKKLLLPETLSWKTDSRKQSSKINPEKNKTKVKEKRKSPSTKEPVMMKPEVIDKFVHTKSKKTLDELVRGSLK